MLPQMLPQMLTQNRPKTSEQWVWPMVFCAHFHKRGEGLRLHLHPRSCSPRRVESTREATQCDVYNLQKELPPVTAHCARRASAEQLQRTSSCCCDSTRAKRSAR